MSVTEELMKKEILHDCPWDSHPTNNIQNKTSTCPITVLYNEPESIPWQAVKGPKNTICETVHKTWQSTLSLENIVNE